MANKFMQKKPKNVGDYASSQETLSNNADFLSMKLF